ncbi:hypothetical protein HK104_010963 [Borealophlyctis nickersoniae]|nr:hypothetical protein HK104_010963 [Borealophlyctis nickersoniae]
MAADVREILEIYKRKATGFILVCHSYGCNIGTFLYPNAKDLIKAIIFICPKVEPSPHEQSKIDQLVKTPAIIVDAARALDRRGGVQSASVNRYVGEKASIHVRMRQLKWNTHNPTVVVKRTMKMAHWAGPEDYAKIDCRVLLIGGKEDRFTPVSTNLNIVHQRIINARNVPEPFIIPNAAHSAMLEEPDVVNAIMYNWLMECGFSKMDLADQLLREIQDPDNGKWNLKNYAKWVKTASVSDKPVKGSLFRPMKTMKQDDPVHTPGVFAAQHPEIGLIIDISRETPPYDPKDFENTTCTYTKVATTSKIPPTRDDVERFAEVVDVFCRENPDRHIGVVWDV